MERERERGGAGGEKMQSRRKDSMWGKSAVQAIQHLINYSLLFIFNQLQNLLLLSNG